jgi:hypothetical protein
MNALADASDVDVESSLVNAASQSYAAHAGAGRPAH